MFILRSAFWLGLAMIVLLPRDWDAATDMRTAGQNAVHAGKTVVSQQVSSVNCTSFECASGKALLIASGITANPLLASPMQDSKALYQAPVPRPRLKRAG